MDKAWCEACISHALLRPWRRGEFVAVAPCSTFWHHQKDSELVASIAALPIVAVGCGEIVPSPPLGHKKDNRHLLCFLEALHAHQSWLPNLRYNLLGGLQALFQAGETSQRFSKGNLGTSQDAGFDGSARKPPHICPWHRWSDGSPCAGSS